MLKVLWIIKDIGFPPTNGPHVFNYNLLRELQGECRIDLMTFDSEGSRVAHHAYGKYCQSLQYLPAPQLDTWNLWKIRLLARFSRLPTDVIRFAHPAAEVALNEALDSLRPELLFLAASSLARWIPALSKRVPTVLAPIDSRTKAIKSWAIGSRRWCTRILAMEQYLKDRRYEGKYYQDAAACVFVSEEDWLFVKGLNPEIRTRVVPLGIDSEKFSPSDSSTLRYDLIFHGNLAAVPNHDAAMTLVKEIFPLLKRERPQLNLIVVGTSPGPGLTKIAGVTEGVYLTGFVPDVVDYLRSARIYICPVRGGSGVRLKILEAMACGLPVVTYPVNVEGIPVCQGREVLVAESETELVAHTFRLLRDEVLRRAMGAAARDLILREFTWRNSAAALLRVFRESLLTGGRSPVNPGG